MRQTGNKAASTTFSDSSNRVMRVVFKAGGRRGNGYVFNLTRMLASGARYKVRLWTPGETNLETITVNGDAGATLASVVNNINENATMKKYITAIFYKDSTEAFNSNVAFANGQALHGGR